jgi:hypothetical protein
VKGRALSELLELALRLDSPVHTALSHGGMLGGEKVIRTAGRAVSSGSAARACRDATALFEPGRRNFMLEAGVGACLSAGKVRS